MLGSVREASSFLSRKKFVFASLLYYGIRFSACANGDGCTITYLLSFDAKGSVPPRRLNTDSVGVAFAKAYVRVVMPSL